MKKSVKIWLVIAAVLTVAGIALFAGVLAASNWDFGKFSTDSLETNTYQVTESFESISISVDTTKITFVLTDADTCSIVCRESEKVKHSVAVQNGTLTIETVDSRKWYDHIGIFVNAPQMTVYLPQTAYTSLFIETDTGDIAIPGDFSFETLKIDGDTADVDCFAPVSGTLEAELSTGDICMESLAAGRIKLSTDTGDIQITAVTVTNDIDIETDTGNVLLEKVSCTELHAQSDTGNIALKNTTAAERFSIESQTGNVIFDHSDAGQIFVGTSTGDVTGSLLSQKVFVTQSATGKVNIPNTAFGGKCQITTATGDIKIVIDP